MAEPLSVFVTTLNNEATLDRCLASVSFADEIVVLDSFSSDNTQAIAKKHGARFEQAAFKGYGPQKQHAMELTLHHWVLLLDADEALTDDAAKAIQGLLEEGPEASGYTLPRRELMFWQWQSPASRMNHYLRLFDKRVGRISDMPVHAAPKVNGPIIRLKAPFLHYGEPDIHTKVDKFNAYSTGLVADKVARGRRGNPWMMVFYPPFVFVRQYFFKRQFLNGWAGFVNSVSGAYYAFLKYAKLYEWRRKKDAGGTPDP